MATDDRKTPEAQPAIVTSTVGDIPRGVEVLVKKASVDSAFRELLLKKRADAAGEIDLALQPAEVMMLNAAPREHLEKIIANTRVRPEQKKAFLGKAAAFMLAALSMQTLGCDCMEGPTKGARPDRPPEATAQPTAPVPPKPTAKGGVRPDRPTPKPEPESSDKGEPGAESGTLPVRPQ